VLGFLLLDQRDDNTLTALQVTPLSLNGYLAYRISLPLLVSFLTTLVMVPLVGLGPIDWPAHLAAAVCSAPLAPIFALFNAAFAQNKVQGFAVMKASSVISIPPLVAYFVTSGWQWLFGLVPTYWPVKVYWLLQAGSPSVWPWSLGWRTRVAIVLALLVPPVTLEMNQVYAVLLPEPAQPGAIPLRLTNDDSGYRWSGDPGGGGIQMNAAAQAARGSADQEQIVSGGGVDDLLFRILPNQDMSLNRHRRIQSGVFDGFSDPSLPFIFPAWVIR
jgi:hypothetical protein